MAPLRSRCVTMHTADAHLRRESLLAKQTVQEVDSWLAFGDRPRPQPTARRCLILPLLCGRIKGPRKHPIVPQNRTWARHEGPAESTGSVAVLIPRGIRAPPLCRWAMPGGAMSASVLLQTLLAPCTSARPFGWRSGVYRANMGLSNGVPKTIRLSSLWGYDSSLLQP